MMLIIYADNKQSKGSFVWPNNKHWTFNWYIYLLCEH